MNSRTVRAIVGMAVGLAAVATPAIALAATSGGGPAAKCPTPNTTIPPPVQGVVVRPENPSKNQVTPSQRPSDTPTATISPSDSATATITPSDTATATVAPKPTPIANRTLEIRVTGTPHGKAGMKQHTYTVVDCNGTGGSIKRGSTVLVQYYRVRGDSHRLYATDITVEKTGTKPGKPHPKPKPRATAAGHSARH